MGDIADYWKQLTEQYKPLSEYGVAQRPPDWPGIVPQFNDLKDSIKPFPYSISFLPDAAARNKTIGTGGETDFNSALEGAGSLWSRFLYGQHPPEAASTLGVPTNNTPTEMRGGTNPFAVSAKAAGIPTPNFKALQMGLEQNRKALEAARDAAIRKNGSAAGAQYNDAIARVEQEMAQLEEAKRQTDTLYSGVQAGAQNLFDQAIANANFGPEAQAAQERLAVQQQVQTRQDFDKIYSDTTDVLSRIGVDDKTAHVVAGKVKEVQNRIEDSTELQSGYREQIAALSGELAQAAAQYASATSAADLGRKRVMAQLGIDKNLQDLAQQKEDLLKARARAVSAARKATADQYDGWIPADANDYGQMYIGELLREHNVEPGKAKEVGQVAQALSQPWQFNPTPNGPGRFLANGAENYDDVEKAIYEMVGQDQALLWTPDQIKLYAPVVWQSIQVYREGVDYYTNTLAAGSAADNRYFAPNSLDRTVFNYAHSVIPGYNEEDARAYARAEAANGVYYPRRPESYVRGLSR